MNVSEFTGSPQYLYKNHIRVYFSHMSQRQIDSFCKLFQFETGFVIKNDNYGIINKDWLGLKINTPIIMAFLKCKNFSLNLDRCINRLKSEYEQTYLQITCKNESKQHFSNKKNSRY